MYKKNNKKDIDIMKTLSNNSHELFHSNIWKWLIDTDKNFAKVFFPAIEVDKIKKVEREDKNRDIVLYVNDKAIDDNFCYEYVIENKLKSLPDKEQLKKYKEKTDKNIKSELKKIIKNDNKIEELIKNNKYLLICLIDEGFECPEKWGKCTYKKLCKKIKKCINESKNNQIKKYKSLLNEYCDYLEELHNNYKSIALDKKYKSSLNDGKESKYIFDYSVADKILGAIIINDIKNNKEYKKLKNEINKKGYELIEESKYMHNYYLVEYRIKAKFEKNVKKYNSILIQIQEGQYRYCVETINEIKNNVIENIKKIFENKWIDGKYKVNNKDSKCEVSEKKKENIYKKRKTKMTKQILKFGKRFKYQYWVIDEKMKWSEIYKCIIDDLNEISKYLNKRKVKKFFNEIKN